LEKQAEEDEDTKKVCIDTDVLIDFLKKASPEPSLTTLGGGERP
jgi:hypothetical protein